MARQNESVVATFRSDRLHGVFRVVEAWRKSTFRVGMPGGGYFDDFQKLSLNLIGLMEPIFLPDIPPQFLSGFVRVHRQGARPLVNSIHEPGRSRMRVT